MEDSKNTCSGTPNPPRGACLDSKSLDAMSAVELAEGLERVWGEMDEDSYDESVISAYLDALDRKVPLPDHPDAQTAYRRFSELTGKQVRKSGRGASGGILRAAIAAVVTLAVVFGAMITAQAAGLDVFGRIARWTKETFSFGATSVEQGNDTPWENGERAVSDVAKHKDNDLSEFQKALDSCGITSIKAPVWIPDGYTLENVSVMDLSDYNLLSINGEFEDSCSSRPNIVIGIIKHIGTYPFQIQNDKEIVDSFNINNVELFLVENEQNSTITWINNDIEFQINGGSTEQLKRIAESMIA